MERNFTFTTSFPTGSSRWDLKPIALTTSSHCAPPVTLAQRPKVWMRYPFSVRFAVNPDWRYELNRLTRIRNHLPEIRGCPKQINSQRYEYGRAIPLPTEGLFLSITRYRPTDWGWKSHLISFNKIYIIRLLVSIFQTLWEHSHSADLTVIPKPKKKSVHP